MGIIGRTGAGKSSLIYCLLRLIDPTYGRITIDNIDTQTVLLKDLRRSMSLIPQNPFIFKASIMENIDPLK